MDHDALPHKTTPDYQNTVFSLPELRANIVPFLAKADIQAMIQTCTAWLDLWAPELYTRLILSRYSRSDPMPNLVKYGRHVQSLRVYNTQFQPTMFVIQHTPNLRRFELSYASLSSTEVDQVLSALPAEVHHLYATPVSLVRQRVGGSAWFQPMFHSVAHLHNLHSLEWNAPGMTIHVDDILHVLQACPHLVSLEISNLKIVYLASGSSVEHETVAMSGRPSDPPSLLVSAILDTDVAALYIGRRLQKLALHSIHVSDEGVLRLLGIDMVPKDEATSVTLSLRSHALMHLIVDHCYSLTHRSGTRIMQECDRIQYLNLSQSMIATIELFQGGGGEGGGQNLWSCSKSMQQLSLDIKLSNFDPTRIYKREAMLRDRVPPLAMADQLLIRDQFRALTGLQLFHLTGYPIDFVVLEDMAFARNLQAAEAQLMCRVPFESVEQELERLERLAKEWSDNQPEGWQVTVGKGTPNYSPKFLVKFLARNTEPFVSGSLFKTLK
ncbi:hypothetical protein BGZ93_002877 [Podila epicladia]|nr:hypothetical protein BGZ92_008628 [Podila epicladia]KAG0097380.1 hypothetical protein BGZ93_002877 [Podila epicladia]